MGIDITLLDIVNESNSCRSLLYDLGLLPEQIKTKEQEREFTLIVMTISAYEDRIRVLERKQNKLMDLYTRSERLLEEAVSEWEALEREIEIMGGE